MVGLGPALRPCDTIARLVTFTIRGRIFSFEELATDSTPYRVVYALDQRAVDAKNVEIAEGPSLEPAVFL